MICALIPVTPTKKTRPTLEVLMEMVLMRKPILGNRMATRTVWLLWTQAMRMKRAMAHPLMLDK